jgi:hypothetical protein
MAAASAAFLNDVRSARTTERASVSTGGMACPSRLTAVAHLRGTATQQGWRDALRHSKGYLPVSKLTLHEPARELSPGADAAWGEASPGGDVGGEPSPGADEAGVSTIPVQMRRG